MCFWNHDVYPCPGKYYGTDISKPILEKNSRRVKEEGHTNIVLECLFADEIDQLEEKDFDLIIINSVIQSFHGHNYLRKVLDKARNILKSAGHIFIGDILDQDLKKELEADMAAVKEANTNPAFKTKTDGISSYLYLETFLEIIWPKGMMFLALNLATRSIPLKMS